MKKIFTYVIGKSKSIQLGFKKNSKRKHFKIYVFKIIPNKNIIIK